MDKWGFVTACEDSRTLAVLQFDVLLKKAFIFLGCGELSVSTVSIPSLQQYKCWLQYNSIMYICSLDRTCVDK